MAHELHGPAANPTGPTQGIAARSRRARSVLQPLSIVPTPVSDEQLLAFVEAAQALSQRQRDRAAGISSAVADERLLRLDWAVRAGWLELAARAARRRTRTTAPALTSAARQRR